MHVFHFLTQGFVKWQAEFFQSRMLVITVIALIQGLISEVFLVSVSSSLHYLAVLHALDMKSGKTGRQVTPASLRQHWKILYSSQVAALFPLRPPEETNVVMLPWTLISTLVFQPVFLVASVMNIFYVYINSNING